MTDPTPPDWRDGMWRYTAEVGNTVMAIAMANAAYRMLSAANSYVNQSDYSLKTVTSKSSAEALADNLRKAIEAAETHESLGERVANFTLSSQWSPKGYLCCGSRRKVAFQEGLTYSSRISIRVKYNAYRYTGTLEGKKDKDKDKDKVDYAKIGEALGRALKGDSEVSEKSQKDKQKGDDVIFPDELEEAEKKPKKVVFDEVILQNASITLGEGKPTQLGWGTALNLSTEIGGGFDDRGLYYEFRISWSERCTTANFNDVVWIKCYASGEVDASASFYDACDTVDDVLKALSAGGKKSSSFTEDAEYVDSDKERAMRQNAERLNQRNPVVLDLGEDSSGLRRRKNVAKKELDEESPLIIVDDNDLDKQV